MGKQSEEEKMARTTWATPQYVFDAIEEHLSANQAGFTPFAVDLAASEWNTKVRKKFITKEQDCLSMPWDFFDGQWGWGNFPWNRTTHTAPGVAAYVAKAVEEYCVRPISLCLLLPAGTDTGWFRKSYVHCRKVIHLPRISYEPPPGIKGGSPDTNSMLMIFSRGAHMPSNNMEVLEWADAGKTKLQRVLRQWPY